MVRTMELWGLWGLFNKSWFLSNYYPTYNKADYKRPPSSGSVEIKDYRQSGTKNLDRSDHRPYVLYGIRVITKYTTIGFLKT